jgi:phosphoglycolate phosphatase-like HAD superfamily hydrolase
MYGAIAWDYDGPIVNARISAYDFMKKLCEKHNKPFPYKTPEDLTQDFKAPFPLTYEMLGFNWKTEKGMIWKEYIKYCEATPKVLVPGAKKIIRELQARDRPQGIASDSRAQDIKSDLERFGIAGAFETVASSCETGDTRKLKPNSDAIIIYREHLQIPFEDILFVGDLETDLQQALRDGTAFCGIGWGLTPPSKMEELIRRHKEEEPDRFHYISKPEELLQVA